MFVQPILEILASKSAVVVPTFSVFILKIVGIELIPAPFMLILTGCKAPPPLIVIIPLYNFSSIGLNFTYTVFDTVPPVCGIDKVEVYVPPEVVAKEQPSNAETVKFSVVKSEPLIVKLFIFV